MKYTFQNAHEGRGGGERAASKGCTDARRGGGRCETDN